MEAAPLMAPSVPEANDKMVELVMTEFKKGPIANKPSMGALLAAPSSDLVERYKKMMLERKFNLIESELLAAFGLSRTEQLKKAAGKLADSAMAALRSVWGLLKDKGPKLLDGIAGFVAAAAAAGSKASLPARVAVIDSRYGTVVAPSMKGMTDGVQYIATGFEKFTKEELKQHLGNGRHLENRYAPVKSLLSLTPAQLANRNLMNRYKNFTSESLKGLELSSKDMARLKEILALRTNTRLPQGRYNGKISFPSLALGRSVPAPAPKNSLVNSIMNDVAVKAALAELYKEKSTSTQNLIRRRVELAGTKNAALELITRLRSRPTINLLKELSNVKFNDRTPLEELLVLRTSRQFPTLNRTLQNNLDKTLRTKMYDQAERISRENIDYQRLQRIAVAVRNTRNNLPGSSTYKNSLKRYINRLGNRVDKIRSNENTIMRLASASRGLTGINASLRNAQARIVRLRRRENNNRRSRGLPPQQQQQLLRNERIRYEPEPPRLRGYGNIPPVFAPPPNMRQPGIIPMPPPPAPPRALPMNNYRQTPAPPPPPQPLETYLPPMEQAAVENVGGVNKAINLVENAGGPSNIVKTANILKTVGNNPNAAIAAGANAKNVRIVLQLGGANNALKVASAVPKLKKRRKSKKPEPKPKPPRVKEIKKLIKYLGSKKNLVRRLPNEEDREKKLTKDQVVSKITRHLLRKN